MRVPPVASVLVVGIVAIVAVVAAAAPRQAPARVPGQNAGVSPTVRVLKRQDFWGEYAIWGATGVDRAGHIFLGMTSNDERGSGSAHPFDYNPATDKFTDRGDVVAELDRLKLRRKGETQMKIHSRIVVASDGYQYFSSMDESGEAADGSKLPVWGGHLWRRGLTGGWEPLTATPEAHSFGRGRIGGRAREPKFFRRRPRARVCLARYAAGAGPGAGGARRIRYRSEGSGQSAPDGLL